MRGSVHPTTPVVLALARQGLTTGEIAARVGRSIRAVRSAIDAYNRRSGEKVRPAKMPVGPRPQNRLGPLHDDQVGRGLTEADLVPCARCGLRGHVAGDPDRCTVGQSLRLGEWQ